jgi:hypothetical protein
VTAQVRVQRSGQTGAVFLKESGQLQKLRATKLQWESFLVLE